MIETKDGIQGLADQLAVLRRGRGDDGSSDALIREMGLDPEAFTEWVVDDVKDTIEMPGSPLTPSADGVVRMNAAQLGALMATHTQVYMELGFALGKGEIGAAAPLGNGWLGVLAAANVSLEQVAEALLMFLENTPPGAAGTGGAREVAERLARAKGRA